MENWRKAVAIGACSDEPAATGEQWRLATRHAADLARCVEPGARSTVTNLLAVWQADKWIAGEMESESMPINWLFAGNLPTRIKLLQQRLSLQMAMSAMQGGR